MDITSGSLGPEASYSVKFENKKLLVTVSYTGNDLSGSFTVSIDSDHLIDKLEEAIPGQVDNLVLETIKAAL